MSELDQYDYTLPADLIAQHPLANRVDARLLIVDRARGQLDHAHIRDLPEILSASDCLVLNDTRVLAARLVGRRTQTGGRWAGLFLAADPQGVWHLMGRTRGKLQPGEQVTLDDRHGRPGLSLQMLAVLEDGSWLARPDSSQDALSLLDRFGRVPLPPYIRDGEMQPSDMEQYQTVYAARPGAVAAPTAGLHFTQGLLNTLQTKGVEIGYVTLHVGAGTFRPITAEHLEQHQMHAEWGTIADECVRRVTECRQRGGRAVAVGSTAVRVLETAAADGTLRPWQGETRLFIRPPYAFQAVDAMLTNFHLPKTTLLVMVRAFGGDALIRRAYEEAIKQQYRFYSYGDAMLIL